MTKAILYCCDEKIINGDFNEVLSLGISVKLGLLSKGISSQNIFDVKLPDLDTKIREKIEDGLYSESISDNGTMLYNIAFQHIQWRFIKYYQYKLRIETLILKNKINHFTLSSSKGSDLEFACLAACINHKIPFVILKGNFSKQSSLLSHLATYDLPKKTTKIESIFRILWIFYYRYKGIKTFYETYNNFNIKYPHATSFSWRRSVCFPGFNLPKFNSFGINGFINLNTPIITNHNIKFNTKFWNGLDKNDLKVLESSLYYFLERYKISDIENLFKSTKSFFKNSKAERLILNSDNTCSSRLLCYAAKAGGLKVDYLPHGLIADWQPLRTGTKFGVDRILAWNKDSNYSFRNVGKSSDTISHPSNLIIPKAKKKLPSKLNNLRVLIMPPEWVGLSFLGRPDCFENDLLEIFKALDKLEIQSAHVKYHNAVPIALKAKEEMLTKIKQYSPIDFNIIESNKLTQNLYEKYDLVIMGPTTGILEVSRSSTPFILFRSSFYSYGIFSKIKFLLANNAEELVFQIKNYDNSILDQNCIKLSHSLSKNKLPLSVEHENFNL